MAAGRDDGPHAVVGRRLRHHLAAEHARCDHAGSAWRHSPRSPLAAWRSAPPRCTWVVRCSPIAPCGCGDGRGCRARSCCSRSSPAWPAPTPDCCGWGCPAGSRPVRSRCGLGVAGVCASACIYRVPSRPAWNTPFTLIQFNLTAGILGPLFAAAVGVGQTRWLAIAAAAMAGGQFLLLALRFLRCIASDSIELRGTARLLSTVLRRTLLIRGALLALGAIALPLLVSGSGAAPVLVMALALAAGARRRDSRSLPVLRQRCSQAHGRALSGGGK